MTEIIDAIDEWTTDWYDGDSSSLKLFGFCELMRKSAGGKDQPMPATMPDAVGNRIQVSLDDKFEFITWMRWEDQVRYDDNEDWSFGKGEARVATVPIRLVIAHKTTLGEDLIFDFINSFPSKFSINGFQFVFANPTLSIDPNHENIYLTELGENVYEKHRFPWNLYVVTVNVEFMQCRESDSSDFITDEFGNCLTA